MTRLLYPQGNSPLYPLDRRLGRPLSRSGRGGEQKNSQPIPRIEPLIILPVAQRYTTIPALPAYPGFERNIYGKELLITLQVNVGSLSPEFRKDFGQCRVLIYRNASNYPNAIPGSLDNGQTKEICSLGMFSGRTPF
jgi:hypothetical protein